MRGYKKENKKRRHLGFRMVVTSEKGRKGGCDGMNHTAGCSPSLGLWVSGWAVVSQVFITFKCDL